MGRLRGLTARALNRAFGPIIPHRLKLAFAYQLARIGGCEQELSFLHHLGPNRGTALDLGANAGLYTYRMARLYERVEAFEIDPVLAAELASVVPQNVCVRPEGLSSKEGTGVLYTPILNHRRLTGWNSLETCNCPGADRYEESIVRFRPLDALKIQNITFMKIDVEGHEVEVLNGASETLQRNRPVVLIEVREKNLPTVRAFFLGLGYVEKTLKELTGKPSDNENHIFAPL